MSGLPKTVILSPEEVREAISEPVASIVDSVIAVGEAPPRTGQDLIVRGMHLVGGGGLLKGLARRIAEETEIPVTMVDAPLECVVMGAGRCIEHYDQLRGRCSWALAERLTAGQELRRLVTRASADAPSEADPRRPAGSSLARVRPTPPTGWAWASQGLRALALLDVQQIEVRFGAGPALDGLSFDVEAGTICALIGSERRGQDHAVQLRESPLRAVGRPDHLRRPGPVGPARAPHCSHRRGSHLPEPGAVPGPDRPRERHGGGAHERSGGLHPGHAPPRRT